MKAWHAYVVVVAVVIAVATNLIALSKSNRPSDREDHAALRASVDALSARIDELRAAVHEFSTRPLVRTTEASTATRASVSVGEPAPGGESGPRVEPSDNELQTEPVDIVLEMDAAGSCTLAGRGVGPEELGTELKRVLQANPAMQLVVRAHAETPEAQVQAVLEAAWHAGIFRISLATSSGTSVSEDQD